jgi:hypothetical protein
MPEVKKTEANGGHRGDRTLHRTRSWNDRARLVSTTQQSGARVLGFATDVSGHLRDRRVRSGAQRELKFARSIGRAACPVTRDWTHPVVEGAYWTLTGHWHYRVRSMLRGRVVLCDRRVRSFDGRIRSLPGARPVIGLTIEAQWPLEDRTRLSTSSQFRPTRPVIPKNVQ